MTPKSKRKIAKNFSVDKDYQEIIDAAIVAKAMKITHDDLKPFRAGRYVSEKVCPTGFRKDICRAIADPLEAFHSRRYLLNHIINPVPAAERFDRQVGEMAKRFEAYGIRGWRISVKSVPSDRSPDASMCDTDLSVRIPKGVLYRGGFEYPGYMSPVKAVWVSPMTGVILFGMTDITNMKNEILGDVRIGMAIIFRSSEKELRLQYEWFCMAKKMMVKRAAMAPCGFGDSPDKAIAAAIRSSAKIMRDSLKETSS